MVVLLGLDIVGCGSLCGLVGSGLSPVGCPVGVQFGPNRVQLMSSWGLVGTGFGPVVVHVWSSWVPVGVLLGSGQGLVGVQLGSARCLVRVQFGSGLFLVGSGWVCFGYL